MNLLSWNVRALGKDRTFREAQHLLQEHKSKIFFLSETKMTVKQVQEKENKLNFQNCLAVSREGMGGGLALLWSSEVTVDIKSYSKHHVDAVIHGENGRY
ncbi:hypothetical protein AB3S75_006749 [Citrus x aurantiifolia]